MRASAQRSCLLRPSTPVTLKSTTRELRVRRPAWTSVNCRPTDRRGYRRGLLISVDTGEFIPRDMMTNLTVDTFGNRFEVAFAEWHKLRTYSLIPGECDAPTRASAFNKAISDAIHGAVKSAMLQKQCESEVKAV
ncbi:hypothetical protein GQ600_3303 [Phytophthora cactorum]|nr:hypothetical protein GQ600_3303 [Phytophthora cactorum]